MDIADLNYDPDREKQTETEEQEALEEQEE